MDSPRWTDVTMAWTGIASLLVTTVGILAVFLQIQKVRQALWSNTQSKLCDQSFELLRYLTDHPLTYDYFTTVSTWLRTIRIKLSCYTQLNRSPILWNI